MVRERCKEGRKMAIAKTEVNSVANIKTYGKIVLTLQNCLLPTDKFDTTPSCADGLDLDMECDLRILGCELIQTAGILLRLPQVAMATGQVLFQRFFHSKSFIKHNMEIVAMGCVCLASKIEEAPRRIRDVINVFHHIKQVRNKKTIQPLILDQNYINLKNQVIKSERRVLKELGFCVHVKHPHKIIVMYLQVLECEKNHRLMQTSCLLKDNLLLDGVKATDLCEFGFQLSKSKFKKIFKLLSISAFIRGDRNYMNDSLRTPAFLRYQPETVACACIYLSARQLKIPLPNKPAWFLIFGVTEEDIQDICLTILRLYTRKRPDGDRLEKCVEDIRKIQLDAKLKAKGISGNNTPQGMGSGFSPSSRPNSPRQDKSPSDIKKEKIKDESKGNLDKSPRNRESNHIKKRSRTPDSNKSGRLSRSSGSTGSPSPKRKTRTPPRGYKDTRKSNSRSRTRSRSRERHVKESKHRTHKRRRSRSLSRSRSRSPHRISNMVSGKKTHHKDTKSRYSKRSPSRDRERERNHRERSRSRSRSYDKYKTRKDRTLLRDNGHHHRRSRSRDRSRR